MIRREYLVTAAAALSVAGCTAGETEPDDDEPARADDTTNGTEPQNGDDDDGFRFGESENGLERDPPIPGAVHHWPLRERSSSTIEDVLGNVDGRASPGLENVNGDWYDGFAEFAPDHDTIEYIDLGYPNTITRAATDRTFTILATVQPTRIVPTDSMTILGAGGGESNWLEFRLNSSVGDFSGQPLLLVRDDLGNTVHAAANWWVQPDTPSRVAVRYDGRERNEVSFWIDGVRVRTIQIQSDELTTRVDPDQSFGIFASNPTDPGSVRTRRPFYGTIDDVIFCNEPVPGPDILGDYERAQNA